MRWKLSPLKHRRGRVCAGNVSPTYTFITKMKLSEKHATMNSTQELIAHKVGGQTLIECMSGALELLTGGLSEAIMLPVRQYLRRQIQQLNEVLLEEMRAGKIDDGAVINEDHLVAFVLRVGRAAMEGAAKKS
jgi:hypothetical protein